MAFQTRTHGGDHGGEPAVCGPPVRHCVWGQPGAARSVRQKQDAPGLPAAASCPGPWPKGCRERLWQWPVSCAVCAQLVAASICLPLLQARQSNTGPLWQPVSDLVCTLHAANPRFQVRLMLQAHHNDPASPPAASSRTPGLPRMPLTPTSLKTPGIGGGSLSHPGVSLISSSAAQYSDW